MSERQRLRRQNPARVEPIRNWSNLYRNSDSWGKKVDEQPGTNAAEDAARDTPAKDAVERGVQAGYQVVEEHIRQIRQGQWIAGEINHGPYDSRGIGDDVLDILERLYRYSRDLMPLWSDLAGLIARAPRLVRDLVLDERDDFETPAGATSGAVSIAVEVSSSRRTRVCIDLRADFAGRALGLRGLYAVDPAKPPLTELNFVHANGDDGVALEIHIKDEQPAGVYSGVIFELDSEKAGGTLSVAVYD